MNVDRLIFLLLIVIYGCDIDSTESKLTSESWIIEKGYYQGVEIEFERDETFILSNRHGKRYIDLTFFKDNKILLPGVDIYAISAKWKLNGDQITFTVDTADYYRMNYIDKASEMTAIFKNDSTLVDSLHKLQTLKINSDIAKIKYSFKVYENPFIIKRLDKQELILESETTKIYAVRDNTLDGIL
jgi:hypothetical protein